MAERAGSNYAYFSQLVYGHRTPSPDKARELERASGGRLTVLELLFPPPRRRVSAGERVAG